MRKCYANANMLMRKFVKCSPDVKCYLFKTYCCNLYCAPFWYDPTKAAMKNLQVAYHISLRRLLGLPSHNSAFFCVSNGVKQGGIISPVLFNVYMDDLSCVLNRSNIGGEIVNHLSYAHDLCLICLSSACMQTLLNGCSKYATTHSLSYNASKSYSLCFNATTIKFKRPTLHIGQTNIPNVTAGRYLGITISVKNCDLDLKR